MRRKIFCIYVLCILFYSNTIYANKTDVRKEVITYFRKNNDADKVKAAEYILNNLMFHYTVEGSVLSKYEPFFKFLDSLNLNKVPIRETASLNVTPSVARYWARVTFPILNSDFTDVHRVNDADVLTAEYIINVVNKSVDTWKSRTWSIKISLDEFCEYILPYRVFNEPIEDWQTYFSNRYNPIIESDGTHTNPVRLADSINNELGTWFSFASLFYQFPFDMGLTRLLQAKTGNCTHMVTTAIYAFRSVGIPCAVDYCPQYGNRSSGHSWVAVIDTNRNVVPVNGVSTQWLKMGYVFHQQTMDVKLPKVLRKTFAPEKTSLAFIQKGDANIPSILADPCIKDVSSTYMPTSTISIPLTRKVHAEVKHAYLCVFDNKQWVPVWWGDIALNCATFKDMGRDIVYLPAVYSNGRLDPIGNPFLLTKDGEVREIKIQLGRAQGVNLFSKYPLALTAENDSTNGILPNNKYELLYWNNNGWESLGRKELSDTDLKKEIGKMGLDFKKTYFFEDTDNKQFLFYGNVPVGGLFLLRNLTQGKEERIFTIEEGKQIWW